VSMPQVRERLPPNLRLKAFASNRRAGSRAATPPQKRNGRAPIAAVSTSSSKLSSTSLAADLTLFEAANCVSDTSAHLKYSRPSACRPLIRLCGLCTKWTPTPSLRRSARARLARCARSFRPVREGRSRSTSPLARQPDRRPVHFLCSRPLNASRRLRSAVLDLAANLLAAWSFAAPLPGASVSPACSKTLHHLERNEA